MVNIFWLCYTTLRYGLLVPRSWRFLSIPVRPFTLKLRDGFFETFRLSIVYSERRADEQTS